MNGRIAVTMLVLALATPATAAMVDAGESFPEWNLTAHTGAEVSSAELRGTPYLLWYYPKAMTPGCTTEGRALRDQIDAYRSAGIEILGVSFDAPEDNRRFVEAESFPFRLLSDQDKKLALAVGAATSPEQGFARRISYLVGADGEVINAYDQVSPADHAAEVLADFAAATGAQKKP